MVKVLLLKQLFDFQQILPLKDEPLEIKVISNVDKTFIVATKTGWQDTVYNS